METRLNCYNYIFSSCRAGKHCPYGHVIVNNKEEYYRNYELNINNTRERTSQKTNVKGLLGNLKLKAHDDMLIHNHESSSKTKDLCIFDQISKHYFNDQLNFNESNNKNFVSLKQIKRMFNMYSS